jgi:hypothetical protein
MRSNEEGTDPTTDSFDESYENDMPTSFPMRLMLLVAKL